MHSFEPETIYLDYNATTPMDVAIRSVMAEALTCSWGNPSSVHRVGRRARALLDDARDRVAALLGCKPSEVVFTSGGTEANNLAVLGAARAHRNRGRHLVCSPIEHHAVLHCFEYLVRNEGFELTILPVDSLGVVSPDDVGRAIRPDTVLVSVMAANNEIGVLQPVSEIGRICRERGVLFHSDAVQWFGKEPFSGVRQFEADLVTLCAHKLHGPKGAGALFIRSPLRLDPILLGGAHENDRRAGTENLGAILGLAEALYRFVPCPVFDREVLGPWVGMLEAALRPMDGVEVLGSPDQRLCNTLAFSVVGADSIGLLANLDLRGVCASSGSACSAGSLSPSHVLLAMGIPKLLAGSLVRLSMGRENTASEVERVCRLLPEVIDQARVLLTIRSEERLGSGSATCFSLKLMALLMGFPVLILIRQPCSGQ